MGNKHSVQDQRPSILLIYVSSASSSVASRLGQLKRVVIKNPTTLWAEWTTAGEDDETDQL